MFDFNEMIDNVLKREHKPKNIGRYYPSEIGSCLRKVFYSYKYPKPTDPSLLKIFEVGNMLHDFVVRVFTSNKNPHVKLIGTEIPFKEKTKNFCISGRIDNVVILEIDNKKYLIEVKSVKDINFINEPKSQNIAQIQLYMHFTDIHNGILLYIDKTNLTSKSFPVKYDEQTARETVKRFELLDMHLSAETVPEPEARATEKTIWMCKYCDYREKCYEETPKSGRWL